MLKEIWEQPRVLEDVFRGRVNFDTHELHSDTLEHIATLDIERITIISCGTSSFVGHMGKYYLEELAGIPTDVIVASDFKYQKKFINPKTLFVFISQS
jgi:glucosamine--fructose-6-phosphate aminotransferase (isomerizing)